MEEHSSFKKIISINIFHFSRYNAIYALMQFAYCLNTILSKRGKMMNCFCRKVENLWGHKIEHFYL